MLKPGDVLEMPQLGVRTEIRRTSAETGGELFEFEVVGRGRGLLVQPHVHERQSERYEVLEGALRLIADGGERLLRPGETGQVPAGVAHRQIPAGDGPGRVRVQLRPAGCTDAFLVRLRDMCASGGINRWGFPRPLAGAALVVDFAGEGHAARPPLAVQVRLARALLGATSREYVFVDEWDVTAPREAVFHALADARTYPAWWRPVYLDVEADGPAEIGKVSRQHFKGRLPYHLRTRSQIVALERPHVVTADIDGDLRGRGTWTLTETDRGTHVRFDWRVFADRPLLRALTPVLRPLFRWNHNWAIARARDGLEPFARAHADSGPVPTAAR
jgi:uncharacterized protein YndB with AHSA1/START domain/mannose-6-phosphate isomerase-like protein (cupin superfamily)